MSVRLYYEREDFQVYLIVENELGEKVKIEVVNFRAVKYFSYYDKETPLTPSEILDGGTELMIKLLKKRIKELREASDSKTRFKNQANSFLNLSTNYAISKNDWDLLNDHYNTNY